jgi:hypothetical protein
MERGRCRQWEAVIEMVRICVLFIAIVASGGAAASTLLVLPDGSGPYPDLQTAVTAAATGDTILLGDGVFAGEGNRNLLVQDRVLTFRSQADDPLLCRVDLGANQFLLCSGVATDSVTVVHLGLSEGAVTGSGGCIRAFGITLTLDGCILQDSQSDWWESDGGAVSVQGGNLRVTGCTFSGNLCTAFAGGVGGALAAQDATVAIDHSTFVANEAGSTFDVGGRGGAVAIKGGSALITACAFRGNRIGYTNMGASTGAGLLVDGATVALVGCTFVDNEAEGASAGGAFALYGGQGQVTSCTFSHNGATPLGDPFDGGTVYVREGAMTLDACIITAAWGRDGEGGAPVPANAAAAYLGTITSFDSDIWGNGSDWNGPLAGQLGRDGNFLANPCFCDTSAGDFHLCADSWCAPEHNPAHPGLLVGALPVGCEACGCPGGALAVDDVPATAPRLLGAAPNPFNPATVIRFVTPAAGPVLLTVHDLAGRRVTTLVDDACAAGEQAVTWRGRDDAGRAVAGGSYLLRLEAGGAVVTDKLTLLK